MFKTIIINKKDSIYKNMFFDNLSQFKRGIKGNFNPWLLYIEEIKSVHQKFIKKRTVKKVYELEIQICYLFLTS